MQEKTTRIISIDKNNSWKYVLFRWESFLLIIFIAVNIMNAFISPNYLSVSGLFTATSSFIEKAFIALPMAYVLLLGEIDISVGSTVALSAVVMSVAFNAGVPMGLCVILCLLTGTACGMVNGLILTRFTELAPMIVTLGTMTFYRGIAEAILENEAAGSLSSVSWFSKLYWGSIGPVPYMLIIFIILAVVFGIVLHKTTFGRRIYAIGSNRIMAAYAGIAVQKVRFIIYTLTGTFSAITAVFLAARMGSTRSNIASGYEMEAISMVVLGGISSAGGKGDFPGTVIAIFIIGFLRYGLGLINVPSQVMLVIIGALLIVAVLIPNLNIFRLLNKKRSH